MEDEFEKILKDHFTDPAPIVFIIGRHGRGKTDFSLYIAEKLLEMGLVHEVGTNIKVETEDPRIKHITNLYHLKNWLKSSKKRKLFILDEAGIHIDARNPLGKLNKEIRHLAFLLRKYRAKLILVSQRAKDIESTFRDTAMWLATFQKLSKKTALLISNIYGSDEPILLEDIPPTSLKYDTYDIAPFSTEPTEFEPQSEAQMLLKMWAIDNMSFRQISRQTGMPTPTVIRYVKEAVKNLLVNM